MLLCNCFAVRAIEALGVGKEGIQTRLGTKVEGAAFVCRLRDIGQINGYIAPTDHCGFCWTLGCVALVFAHRGFLP